MQNEIFRDAQIKAMRKLLMEFNYDLIIDNPMLLRDQIPMCWENDFNEWMKIKGKYRNQRWKFCMVTVNYMPGAKLANVGKKVTKALKKTWIVNSLHRYECRDVNEESFIGVHSHFWLELKEGKNAYNVKREFYNTFKGLVGTKKHVNVRYSNRETAFVEYVKGYKKGEKKPNFKNDEMLNEVMMDYERQNFDFCCI